LILKLSTGIIYTMKNTYNELIITAILILVLIVIAFSLMREKSVRFEDNGNLLEETLKKVNRDYEVKDRPCFNEEGVEIVCKG